MTKGRRPKARNSGLFDRTDRAASLTRSRIPEQESDPLPSSRDQGEAGARRFHDPLVETSARDGAHRAAAPLRPRQRPRRPAAIIALHSAGRPVWTPRTYQALARAGLHEERGRLSRRAHGGGGGRLRCPWLLYEGRGGARRSSAAGAARGSRTRTRAARTFSRRSTGTCSFPAMPMPRRVTVEGAVRELYALRPDRMSVVPDAERLAGGVRIRGERADRALQPGSGQDGEGGAADPAHRGVPSARRLLRLSAARGGAGGRSTCTTRRTPGTRRCSTTRRGPPARWSTRARTAANLSEEQFERLRDELQANFSGSANAGRPLLLEGGLDLADDEPFAEGHGLHAAEARRGARDRAGLRRAADAARHSRRQHLCELPRGEPRLLAADGAAARRTLRECARQLARAGLRRLGRRAAARLRRRPGGRALGRARGAVAARERGGLPDARREAPGGGIWRKRA